jgi:hypothetical protein
MLHKTLLLQFLHEISWMKARLNCKKLHWKSSNQVHELFRILADICNLIKDTDNIFGGGNYSVKPEFWKH